MFQEFQPFGRQEAATSSNRNAFKQMLSSASEKLRVSNWLFFATVVVPTFCAVLYYGFLASDIYVSESKFVVRSPDKPAASGLGVILKSAGFANAGDELYAAQSFATSRDALRAINRNNAFKTAYTRPQISIVDRFNPFGFSGSFEDLFKYFQKKVRLQNDSATSITTLTVRAYTPDDAYRFNQQLLEMSEATVNRLNDRGRRDLVQYAQVEVNNAKAKAQAAAVALAAYRNRSGIVDPEKQATVQMQMVSKLQDSLIAAKTELAQLQQYTPDNPRIPVVSTQISTIQGEIDRELGKVAEIAGPLRIRRWSFSGLRSKTNFRRSSSPPRWPPLRMLATSLSESRHTSSGLFSPTFPTIPLNRAG